MGLDDMDDLKSGEMDNSTKCQWIEQINPSAWVLGPQKWGTLTQVDKSGRETAVNEGFTDIAITT